MEVVKLCSATIDRDLRTYRGFRLADDILRHGIESATISFTTTINQHGDVRRVMDLSYRVDGSQHEQVVAEIAQPETANDNHGGIYEHLLDIFLSHVSMTQTRLKREPDFPGKISLDSF